MPNDFCSPNKILADGRWRGQHGIGRFATEILARLKHTDILEQGPSPLSLTNFLWQRFYLPKKSKHRIFFTPGFNPVWLPTMKYVVTIHDLIPMDYHSPHWLRNKLFFESLIKPSIKKAYKILTVSEFSKAAILRWVKLSPEQVIVTGCGISAAFTPEGTQFSPGFPYLLHVGNTKPHKNITRLIEAFARARIDSSIKLIFTSQFNNQIINQLHQLKMIDRIISHPSLSENVLASYYRGALGVVFPSLYEGFGLPVIEGMASGVPVLTSNVTSLPEVAADAALLVDPYDIDALSEGITQLINNPQQRTHLITKGLKHVKCFNWDQITQKIQGILDSV